MKRSLLTLGAILASSAMFAQTTFLTEDFQSGSVPGTWLLTQAAGSNGWEVSTSGPQTSQYWGPGSDNSTSFAISNDDACNCDMGEDRLITPSMNLSGATSVFLTFDAYYDGEWGSTGHVEVSTDGGTTWTNLLDLTADNTGWQSVQVDLSSYAGQSAVWVAFKHDDGGGWADGFAVDNVVVAEPNQYDLSVSSIDMLATYGLNNAPIDIVGTITNNGSATINSVTITYTIDGGTPVVDNLTGLNIAPLGTYQFTHATQWNVSTEATYTLEVTVSSPNGNTDQNTANDAMSSNIEVVTATTDRVVLYEYFTSSTCGPCAAMAPTTNALLSSNNTNSTGRVAAVKYQWDFPSPGNDPCFNAQVDARFSHYGVTGIPNAIMDGGVFNNHPAGMSQGIFDNELDVPSLVDLSVNATHNGSLINVDVDINPLADITSNNLRLHIVVTEDQLTHNLISTSESQFYYVARTLLPSQNGTTVASLTAGNTVNVTESKTMTTNTAPVQGANNTLVGDFNGVTVVVFLQDNSTDEVYQAAYVKPTFTGVNEEDQVSIQLYPNPANDNAQLVLDVKNNEDVLVEVLDMNGKIVLSQSSNPGVGTQYINLNTANLATGLYQVRVINGSSFGVKALSIAR